MMSLEHCRDRGTIIIDALLALALGLSFIAIVTGYSLQARDIYSHYSQLEDLMDMYEKGDVIVSSRPFGNDLIEQTLTVSTSTAFASDSKKGELRFIRIIEDSVSSKSSLIGRTYCSVDHIKKDIIGSYGYLSGYASKDVLSVVIKPIILPIDPLLPLTHVEIRGGLAYVSADSAKASDPDLIVFDISDRDHVKELSMIDTGPGLESFVIVGRDIFAAASSRSFALHVTHIFSPTDIRLSSRLKLSAPYATATLPFASSIFYDNGHIYLGTEKWDGAEFNVIDASDPSRPEPIGQFEVGSQVGDIYVEGDQAFIASAGQDQLQILDIKDLANISLAKSFSPSGWSRQEGKTIDIFEGNLAFGRTNGGFDIRADHEAYSWGSSSKMSLTDLDSIDLPGGAYGLKRDRSHIFVASRENDRELQIYDANLSTSTVSAFALPIAPETLTCYGDSLYILAHNAPAIYEISF